MEIAIIDQKRKKRSAFLYIEFAFLVVIGFTIADIIEGDTAETLANLLTGIVLTGGFIALKKGQEYQQLYRLSLAILSTIFFIMLSLAQEMVRRFIGYLLFR